MAQRVVETDVGEEGQVVKNQRLLASVHWSAGRWAEEVGADSGLVYSRGLVAALAQLAFDHLRQTGSDLEAFAQHAKRSTVQAEDVKLSVRRNPQLSDHITNLSEAGAAHSKKRKKAGPEAGERGKRAKKAAPETPFIV